jgi:hypothetical protein
MGTGFLADVNVVGGAITIADLPRKEGAKETV